MPMIFPTHNRLSNGEIKGSLLFAAKIFFRLTDAPSLHFISITHLQPFPMIRLALFADIHGKFLLPFKLAHHYQQTTGNPTKKRTARSS